MKKVIEKLVEIKPQVLIELKSGKELKLNLRMYDIDTVSYDNIVVFSFHDKEYIYVKYEDISYISYTTGGLSNS